MKTITLYVVVNIIALLILFSVHRLRKRSIKSLNGRLYKKCILMNTTEQILFQKLKIALPNYHIFPQIPFPCIATPKRYNQKLFWKISQKRVDFLLCNEQLESILVIELDGASHKNKKQYDKERDNFFKCIGINTLRIEVEELKKLNLEMLKRQVLDKIND